MAPTVHALLHRAVKMNKELGRVHYVLPSRHESLLQSQSCIRDQMMVEVWKTLGVGFSFDNYIEYSISFLKEDLTSGTCDETNTNHLDYRRIKREIEKKHL